MQISLFNKNDSVLLVGEGNFSFAVALLQHALNIELIATCYQSNANQEAAEKNIDYLRNNGVCVLFDVNATRLEEYSLLKSKLFDKIIFNFPHVGGKMRIEKNRDLLRDFFVSCEKVIRENGRVLVTLCNGQGGTPMDNPKRHWNDSWKIVEMAAHGNFILTKIESFSWQLYPHYIVTGYRSLEKQFHTMGSLVHFFTKTEPPTTHNIAPSYKLKICKQDIDNVTWKEIVGNIQDMSDCDIKCIYPCTFVFDLTLSTNTDFNTMEFYRLLYNYAGYVIDNIDPIDYYLSPIDGKIRRTYRINYKSNCLPLYRKRVLQLHQYVITSFIEDRFNVTISK